MWGEGGLATHMVGVCVGGGGGGERTEQAASWCFWLYCMLSCSVHTCAAAGA